MCRCHIRPIAIALQYRTAFQLRLDIKSEDLGSRFPPSPYLSLTDTPAATSSASVQDA